MAKKEPAAARAAVSSAETDVATRVTAAAIRRRAYSLFEAHGGKHGHDVEDWLLAEAELREGHSTDVASPTTGKQGRLG